MSRTITRTRTTTRTVQQTTTLDPDDSERRSLVLVSWNISSSQSSAIAPNPQLRAAEAPRLIREEILRSQPDIIVLQETLCPSYGNDHYSSSGYVSMGAQTAWVTQKHVSLDGTYIDLLVKRELASNAQRITFQTFETNELPAVAAIITLPNRTRIAVASLHLPHTKEAAPIRKRLCSAIMEQLSTQQCEGIILAGDFNMRKFEDNGTEQLCGGNWVDAWKAVTRSNYRKEYTWDGNENLYHGHDSFQFHCRFDRCYVKGEKLRLTHFDLIGNQPVDGKEGDYLSDHYGIVVKIDIGSTSTGSTSTDYISSVNHAQNAAALRAARLQRFEMLPAVPNASAHQRNVNKRKIKKKPREDARDSLIDLSKDSDDENEHTKRSISSRGQHKFNNDNNMVDLTEDSDDEVEILEVAATSNNDGVSANTHQNDTTIASSEDQSGETTQNNDENDSHAGNSQSEDAVNINVDEEEVLKPSATNNDIHAGNIQHMDDTKVAEEEVSNMGAMNSSDNQSRNNQSDEDSIDIQVDHVINENAMHSNPASPSLFYASSTASTPIRDNRASKPASKKEAQTKRKKRHHLSNSSSDDDDFAIMRAKLAKKKQSRDSSDSEDDFDEMRTKLKTKQH
eukprot:scaffold23692_cov155-Skeletonema_dohrnii-CCMP3373.AAC.2